MGMSTSVYGIVPPDEQWKNMKAVWDACEEASVNIPEEVHEFFDEEPPDAKGVVVDLVRFIKPEGLHPSVEKYTEDMCSGFEVDITKLPTGVRFVRFVNCW